MREKGKGKEDWKWGKKKERGKWGRWIGGPFY